MTVSTTTGKDRFIGPLLQKRLAEIRRTAVVGQSDMVEPTTAVGSFSRTVDIVRRRQTAPASPSIGKPATWVVVPGLTGLQAHVRTIGQWMREDEPGQGAGTWIKGNERIITITDIPATGANVTAVPANVITTTDRIRYADPVFGTVTLQVTEVSHRETSGHVTVLATYDAARED